MVRFSWRLRNKLPTAPEFPSFLATFPLLCVVPGRPTIPRDPIRKNYYSIFSFCGDGRACFATLTGPLN